MYNDAIIGGSIESSLFKLSFQYVNYNLIDVDI